MRKEWMRAYLETSPAYKDTTDAQVNQWYIDTMKCLVVSQ